MSDAIIKIIPSQPKHQVSDDMMKEVVKLLKGKLATESIDANSSDHPFFVDCGGNLEEICCPVCGADLGFDWWGEQMGAASESDFEDLTVTLPCCGKESSLNDLKYNFPCGFARVEFSILNPTDEPTNDCLAQVEKILGSGVRLIHAHL